MEKVPDLRIRCVNDENLDPSGEFVLYWMIAFRRGQWNFSLQRAVELARELSKPLVIFEPLRCDYRWASDRMHRFVVDGMLANDKLFEKRSVLYYPYLEAQRGASKGLLAELAKRSCAVISDDYPCFFLPRMIRAASSQIPVRFELVDGNGILPMRAAEKVFARAHDFRRFLQKNLRPHLEEFPVADPLRNARLQKLPSLPKSITDRWPPANLDKFRNGNDALAVFPFDHSVAPVATMPGGADAAQQRLNVFLGSKLGRYEEDRNQPQQEVTSGLSPYLHFGHISTHQIVAEVLARDEWNPGRLAEKAHGSAHDWWGTSSEVESFLDELITWREVGFNMCWQLEDYDQYESLPNWAQATLEQHTSDPRSHIYSLEQFESADTHNDLWNAAQRQLVREGRIHNYLRMVWGKKILEWTANPRDALDVMIELNNKYAVDGRDPNSYSGIFWCLGRYDRAWGPERPIFGKIRYMSTENTARKVKVKQYLEDYGPEA